MENSKRRTQDVRTFQIVTSLPGGNSEWEPPDSIPNSEVKTLSADGSVGSPHVRVGHRQAPKPKPRLSRQPGFFYFLAAKYRMPGGDTYCAGNRRGLMGMLVGAALAAIGFLARAIAAKAATTN